MSQDVRTNQIALKPLEEIPNQPWSMDTAADRLMDDVFEDVDRMLVTGGTPLPTEPVEPEYISLQSVAVPPVPLPAEMRRRRRAAEASLAAKAQKAQKSRKAFERLLLVAACASLGITLLLWLASQGRLNWLVKSNSTSTSVAQAPDDTDARFMDYMQRSLESIEQKAESRNKVAVAPPPPPAVNPQVPVPLPGSLPPVPVDRSPNALERVYIPVYPRPNASPPASLAARPYPQAILSPTARPVAPSPVARATATAAGTSAATPTPRAASPSPTARPTTTASRPPAPPSKATATTSRPATTASRPAVPVPAPPPPPLPSSNQTPARPQQSTQASASQTSVRHVLRGLLRSGDSSKDAALFEVNGITRRIYVGETISSSGWTLVEVRDNEAIIRRNGEVRSIYPEQQF